MNSKRVSCAGKRVYIGIDVHRSFFVASCICEETVVKRCRMPWRLKGIRVPTIAQEQRGLLTRTREQLMRAKRRVQIQVRMKLHQFGLFPDDINRALQFKDMEEIHKTLKGDQLIGRTRAAMRASKLFEPGHISAS